MNTITAILFGIFMCVSYREEATSVPKAQVDSSPNRKSDERISAIEQEMANMSQKLKGKGWSTEYWGIDLANSIMALDDRNERFRLMNKFLDAIVLLESSLSVRPDPSNAFRNYELLVESCTIFKDDPEIAERVMRIICDCVRLHRREVQKWSDAIMNEPNRRARTPLKNIHGVLNSDFMDFTNRIERDYFPWLKSHGLPPDRHEYWRRQINDAYESQRRTEANIREHRKQEEANQRAAESQKRFNEKRNIKDE